MELKVVCYCGQKYKFDVEPVDGRMPFNVNCPVCNVDGTPLANQMLREQAAPAPAVVPPLVPAPASTRSGIRVKMSAPAPAPPALPAASMPPPLPVTGPAVAARPAAPVKPLMSKPLDSPKEFRMGMGILGAFLGAAVGGGLVYVFFVLTNWRFPLSGTAIGIFAGLGARWLARGTDSTLGGIAAVLALASIVGVFYLMYGEFYVGGIISMAVCVYFAYRFAS